jgi:hypothetical protein
MFSADAVRQIIRIALQPITATRHPLYSAESEELLLMVSCHESILGRKLFQIGGGPGRGLFQVEPRTMRDNYTNFIDAKADLRRQIGEVSGVANPDDNQLTWNPLFGAIMARIWLYRRPGPLPPAHDLQAMADYARMHYNTTAGEASPEEYLTDYHRLVLAA